jgi:hypothetical protein
MFGCRRSMMFVPMTMDGGASECVEDALENAIGGRVVGLWRKSSGYQPRRRLKTAGGLLDCRRSA